MKKRWLKFLLEIVVSGMLITGCSKEEKKEESPKTEDVAKDEPKEEVPVVTPEAEENETTSETMQTEEPRQPASDEQQQETVKEPPVLQENEETPKTDSETSEGVPATVILYEGTYFAEEVYKMAADLGNGIYCEIDISNITDTSFDFTVYEVNELEETRSMIFKTHTAVFQGDGTTAVYNGKEYTLNFTFPDYHTSLPHVTDMEVTGFALLEGETYMNNSVPGHEFG